MIQKQIETNGYSRFYSPEISVHHQIQSNRLTPDWFYQRAYWQGISNAVMRIKIERSLTLRAALAVNAWLNILKSFLELSNLFTKNLDRVAPKCKILEKLGYAMMLSGFVLLE